MKRIKLVLWILVFLLCGGLVSCQTPEEESYPDEGIPKCPLIEMDIQYYDEYENYIEIPILIPPAGEQENDALASINNVLAALKEEYRFILTDGQIGYDEYGLDGGGNHCLFYPTVTDRYLNLVFFQNQMFTNLNTGHVLSLVYDWKESRQVTIEEALALAGTTEQKLFDDLSTQFNPQLAQNAPSDANIIIQNHALEGFRIDGQENVIFYLTARTDDADDTMQDAVSGADHLYIWADGVFTIYEQYNIGEEYSEGRIYPLVPAEETVTMETPLWNQWYFSGDEPDVG